MKVDRAFIDTSRFFISGCLNNVDHCLNLLSNEDIWWRPNAESNSIGNLLLHVLGSLNQWILGGIGGAKVHRERQQEFGQRTPIPNADLLSRLNSTRNDVDRVISGLDPAKLSNKMHAAGKEITWMFAIFLMTQHLSMHTGQFITLTKSRTGKDLDLPQFIDNVPDRLLE